MTKFIHYFSGIITGIYISQNYNVPNLNKTFDYLLNQISYFEKNNRK